MGAPKPWPTRWPEPEMVPLDPDVSRDEPLEDPDYDVEIAPGEVPFRLPEEKLGLYSVTWGVTHTCNLHCSHCYDASRRKRSDLTTEQAFGVIDRLAEFGVSFIAFSGGEPMLRRDLFQLMEHCRAKRIGIAMRSNATLITTAKAYRLADMGVQVVGVSLDGATEATHDLVRGRGAYQKTRDGIRALLSARIRVNIEVVLNKRNAHQGLQFIRMAEDWQVDKINFSALVPQGRAAQLENERLSSSTRKELITQLYEASKTARVAVSPSCALTGDCWACIEPNITCDGWVTPCYLSKRKLFHILQVTSAEAKAVLKQQRSISVNICGRMSNAGPLGICAAAQWHCTLALVNRLALHTTNLALQAEASVPVNTLPT